MEINRLTNKNKDMKKLLVIAVVTLLSFASCEQEDFIAFDPQIETCDQIDARYNTLVINLALENGWNPTTFYFNTTDALSPGFFDLSYDPNYNIFRDAYKAFWDAGWKSELMNAGCI